MKKLNLEEGGNIFFTPVLSLPVGKFIKFRVTKNSLHWFELSDKIRTAL